MGFGEMFNFWVQMFKCSIGFTVQCSIGFAVRCSMLRLIYFSIVRLFNCSLVQLALPFNVQLASPFYCSNVRLFKCSNVRLFYCSIVQMFACSIVQMFNWLRRSMLRLSYCSIALHSKVRLFGLLIHFFAKAESFVNIIFNAFESVNSIETYFRGQILCHPFPKKTWQYIYH